MATIPTTNPNYGTPVQPTNYQVQAPVAPQNATPPQTALPNNYDELAKAQPSALEFMQKTDEQLGIPGQQKIAGTVREQIYSLEDQLKRVAPNVDATTKQSLVTQGQRENMINAAQRPIQENIVTQTTNLGRITEGITALQDRAARLTAGFTADKQTNLELALSKIQRGEQLSDTETAQAFESLQSENEYKRQVEMAKTDYERQRALIKLGTDENIRQSKATRVGSGAVTAGGGGKYYDTGKIGDTLYEFEGTLRTEAEINALVASRRKSAAVPQKGLTTSFSRIFGG